MKQLQEIIRNNKLFYLSCLIFLALCGLFLTKLTKAESFISINSLHSSFFNTFFTGYSFLGDGFFTLGLCGSLFFLKQKKLSLCILIAYLTSGLTVQLFKSLVYAPRPRIFFEHSTYFFHLNNFENSGGGTSSFPSGHTTSAFSLATVLALYSGNKYLSLLYLMAALLVGYTRVYLSQHFPVDVLGGALTGIIFGTLAFMITNKYYTKIFPERKIDSVL